MKAICFIRPSALAVVCLIFVQGAFAQFANRRAAIDEQTLSGTVEGVYLSTDRSDPTYIIHMEILPAQGRRLGQLSDAPAPDAGESVFILHSPEGVRRPLLPAVEDRIRATVFLSARGTWHTTGADWFETISPTPDPDAAPGSLLVDLRGMTLEAKIISGQIAFEVKSVEETGAAQEAGFQVGDVITAVDDKQVASVAALKEIAARPAPLKLTVIDINSGRLASVTLAAMKTERSQPTGDRAKPTPSAADRLKAAIGIAVEPARVGARRFAVAVTSVDPDSPGAKAGLERGDTILSVDGESIADADEFAAALPGEGGEITLLVRDTRTGNDVPIRASIRPRASKPSATRPPDARRTAPTKEAGQLGISAELTFYKAEAAVKVVDVVPDSPADRAGLAPGMIILAVNDTPVMHPDELKTRLASASHSLQLTVADPQTGRERKIVVR